MGNREDILVILLSSININTLVYSRCTESVEWMNEWIPMILHSFLLAFGTWRACFSLLAVAAGDDMRKWGVLPVSHDDCTILIICDGKHSRGSPYNRKLLWLELKPWRMKGSLQFGDIRAPETQLSSSHLPCPKRSANYPSPSSVLWQDKVQWLEISPVVPDNWRQNGMYTQEWIYWLFSSASGNTTFGSFRKNIKIRIPICMGSIRNKILYEATGTGA